MKEKKYEIPAKLAYSDFLDENPPAEEYDILNTHEETSSSKKTYSKQLVLPKKVCYSCGKVVEVTNPDSIFEMANNEAKLICSDCKLDAEHSSKHESDHKFAVKSRRKTIIISAVIAAIVYALLLVIAFNIASPRSVQRNLFYAAPAAFYGVFCIMFCLKRKTFVNKMIPACFKLGAAVIVKTGGGFIIFIEIVLALAFAIWLGSLAIGVVMCLFICPYYLIKEYAEV